MKRYADPLVSRRNPFIACFCCIQYGKTAFALSRYWLRACRFTLAGNGCWECCHLIRLDSEVRSDRLEKEMVTTYSSHLVSPRYIYIKFLSCLDIRQYPKCTHPSRRRRIWVVGGSGEGHTIKNDIGQFPKCPLPILYLSYFPDMAPLSTLSFSSNPKWPEKPPVSP